MRKIEMKNRLIFISIFIMILLIIFGSALTITISNRSYSESPIIVLDEETLENFYQNGVATLDISSVTTTKVLHQSWTENIKATQKIYFIISCLTSLVFLAILYFAKNKLSQNTLETAFSEICNSKDEQDSKNKYLYENIKKHFENSMEEFKRLSSYLSHEQKNSIALLRAKLEYDKNYEYIKYVDSLTNNIYDILTLSDDYTEDDICEVDCTLITAEICDEFLQLGIDLNFDFDEDQDCTVSAKTRWISRAIYNLIDNAVKYGQDNLISVSLRRELDSVIVEVNDQGIGIAQEKQQQVFENRYRISSLNSDGYGIGLSLVSHVCDLCKGFVWVESKQGRGSTFYMTMPASDVV